MNGRKAKQLRRKVLKGWLEVEGKKAPFLTVWRRVKKAYVRGLVKV